MTNVCKHIFAAKITASKIKNISLRCQTNKLQKMKVIYIGHATSSKSYHKSYKGMFYSYDMKNVGIEKKIDLFDSNDLHRTFVGLIPIENFHIMVV
jgi:hypothetical protein